MQKYDIKLPGFIFHYSIQNGVTTKPTIDVFFIGIFVRKRNITLHFRLI